MTGRRERSRGQEEDDRIENMRERCLEGKKRKKAWRLGERKWSIGQEE
jgi:hypothetical protein